MEKSNVKTFPKKTEEKKQNHIDSLSPREIVSELDRFVKFTDAEQLEQLSNDPI